MNVISSGAGPDATEVVMTEVSGGGLQASSTSTESAVSRNGVSVRFTPSVRTSLVGRSLSCVAGYVACSWSIRGGILRKHLVKANFVSFSMPVRRC